MTGAAMFGWFFGLGFGALLSRRSAAPLHVVVGCFVAAAVLLAFRVAS